MIEIPLTKGKVALIDDEDYPLVSHYSWHHTTGGGNHKKEYAVTFVRCPDGKWRNRKMHRVICGITDKAVQVDHRDGDGLNNRRYNLRVCTRDQNAKNRRKLKATSSRFKGVEHRPRPNRRRHWKAGIRVNRKWLGLGHFLTEVEAAEAYDRAALKYFGDFACLNFPAKEITA